MSKKTRTIKVDYLARVDRSSSWVIHRCFFRSVVINDFNGNCLGFSTAPSKQMRH